ncbi:hypothetical protein D6D01_03552 [Aureobasidium pullulans]|uniref:Uncharacterized protein n=1 Tax=Aureobasidium pullulans TaxID=5580 RepID=A0A4S9LK63_AURPU|nr:hypothetical protein D6D01_03552 [Aureobasidium pullulans]
MIGFDSFISIVMAVATFFRDNCHPASLFPSWTQYLLPAPTEYFSQQSPPVEYLPVIETFTMVITQTTAATASSLNKALAIIPKTAPYAAPTSSDLARKMIYALYTYILRFFTHPVTLLLFFSFGFELLKVTIIYRIASPPVMKQQDTIRLEAQIIERDGTIEKMRSAHAKTVAELREKLYTQEEKARIARGTAHLVHRVEMGKKEQEIQILSHKLEWSGHMEIKARYDSDDKVRDLEKKIDQLRLVVDTLEDKLEAAGELIDAAEQAADKVKDAEASARAAAQEAREANMKIEAAEKAAGEKVQAANKANKEKIVTERQNAQDAIYKLVDQVKLEREQTRIQEYKVQGLERVERDLKKTLADMARGTAEVPSGRTFTTTGTATVIAATRLRLQQASIPAPVAPVAAPIPAITITAPFPTFSSALSPAAEPQTTTTPAVVAHAHTLVVAKQKGPRPRPTSWCAAGLPNPIRLIRPPPRPIMPNTKKNSRGK